MRLKNTYLLSGLVILQVLLVYLMAVGSIPTWVAWLSFGLILLFIVLKSTFEGLLLAVASMPFYVVLPTHYSDTFSMWRVVVGVLFLKLVWEWWRSHKTISFRAYWGKCFAYEKVAIVLFILGVLSLLFAQYPLRGASQLIFLLNTVLVYPIVVWVVKSREQFIRVLKYGTLSTGIIIAIGYVQFVTTLFTNTYYFWQYWALRVSSLYYGVNLSKVLQYSNSWVTVSGEEKTLRMFSIMPSSHAFAMVCVLFFVFVLPLLYVDGVTMLKKRWLLTTIVLACLAIILSGTRGVWTGMVPALLVVGALYFKNIFRKIIRPIYVAMMLVVILFVASPVIDMGLNWVRHSGGQGELSRLASIVDPNETSNAGRLAMWKAATKYALRHPLGVGYANFVVTLNPTSNNVSFNEAASQENKLYNLPQRYVTAHSLYLQILVELSALGLILFALFWLAYYQISWKYLVNFAQSIVPETVYIATTSIVLLWFLAYSVFDVTWLNDKILLYTFLVLGLVRSALTFNRTNTTNKTNS